MKPLPLVLVLSTLSLAACSSGSSSSRGGGNTQGNNNAAPLSILTMSLPNFQVNETVNLSIQTNGGSAPISFSVTQGALPLGLNLSNAGLISGSPTSSGRFSLTIQAQDSVGSTASQSYAFEVSRRLLLFKGDINVDGIDELQTVDLSGPNPGNPQPVNGTLVAGGEVDSNPVSNELIAPNGLSLCYLADQDTQGVSELYFVDVSGATPAPPIKISGTQTGTGVTDFRWAPNSQSLVYLADQDTAGQFELYLVRFNGATPGAPTKISAPLTADGDVEDLLAIGRGQGFDYSPDSNVVVYQADQNIDGELEIFAVNISSATPATAVRINTSLPSGGSIDFFGFANTSSDLLYSGDQQTLNVRELFFVPFTNNAPGAPIKVNAAITTGTGVINDGQLTRDNLFSSDSGFGFAPDDSGIAYQAVTVTGGSDELFYLPLTNSTPGTAVRVNPNLAANSSDINSFRFTPDGQKIVYNADQDTQGMDELYLATLTNGAVQSVQKINQTIPAAADVRTFINGNGYAISPNGQNVIFLVDADTDNVNELFISDISGAAPTTPTKVNVALTNTSTDINNAFFSADSTRILYVGDQDTAGTDELYLFTIATGNRVKLNGPVVAGGDVQISFAGAQFSPDDQRVVYRADRVTDGVIEIFSVDISGATPGNSVMLNGNIVAGGTIRNFAWSKR